MSGLLDYLYEYGHRTFDEEAFNELDAALLIELAYLPIDRFFDSSMNFEESISVKQLAKLYQPFSQYFEDREKPMVNPLRSQLIKEMENYRRFSQLRLTGFSNQVDFKLVTQSAYLLVELSEEFILVIFRGTDDLLVGWKEDFMLTYQSAIPAQMLASQYLNTVVKTFPDHRFLLAGHSKGGHLAMYAASQLDPKDLDRLDFIYNYDGPGFHHVHLNQSQMKEVYSITLRLVPEESIVGQMLFHLIDPVIVKSRSKGLLQHNIANWQIQGRQFARCDTLTITSKILSQINHQWLHNNSPAKRKRIMTTIFDLIDFSKAKSINHFIEEPSYYLKKVRQGFKGINPETQAELKDFANNYIKVFRHDLRRYQYLSLSQSLLDARQYFEQLLSTVRQSLGNNKD